MNLTTLEYEKREHIAYVTLNRPDKLNAMNADMHRELGKVWELSHCSRHLHSFATRA